MSAMKPMTLVLSFALAACGSARRSEPITGAAHLDADAAHGQQVFMQHCNECHPHGEGGLGPSLNSKPLPAFGIRTQVRKGLGAMPAFSRDQVSDRELDDMVSYMKALRRN